MGKYDHLIGTEIGGGLFSWDADRAMLYAVAVGAGLDDPEQELQFTTENTPGVPQQVIPTFLSHMFAGESDWGDLLDYGGGGRYPIGMVHGDQGVTLARPIPTSGTVRVSRVLLGVYDKGTGALAVSEARMTLADTGEYLGSARMGLFARGLGDFGGPRRPADEQPWSRPEGAPDMVVSLPVGANQSLIFRLLGDHNLHGTDPARARDDGFERPIFYGLGTYGVACRALLRGLCAGDASRFGRIDARFSKPVHPGDRLDAHIWLTEGGAVFQMLANGERLVLDRGVFRFGADQSPVS
jgi:acyl dehydratase